MNPLTVGSAVEVLTVAGWAVHSRFIARDEAMSAYYDLVHWYPEKAFRVVSL